MLISVISKALLPDYFSSLQSPNIQSFSNKLLYGNDFVRIYFLVAVILLQAYNMYLSIFPSSFMNYLSTVSYRQHHIISRKLMAEGSGNRLLNPSTGPVYIKSFNGANQIGGLLKLELGIKRPFLSMNNCPRGSFP